MAAGTLFADYASTTLSAGVVTTPAAGTSEAWAVTSSTVLPAAATGVSQFAAEITPSSGVDLTPETVLVTNRNDTTHVQVQRGYGGTIKVHASGDVLTLVADQAWFAAVEIVRANIAVLTTSAKTANYTLVLADLGVMIKMNSSSATTVTVPQNSSVNFPVGAVIPLVRWGSGTVTLVGAGTVSILSPGIRRTLANQYSSASLRQDATDIWNLTGDLA